MANQKMNDELSLEELEAVNGGKSIQSSLRSQNHQYLPPIDAEFGFTIPHGKCGLDEILVDGKCVPSPKLG